MKSKSIILTLVGVAGMCLASVLLKKSPSSNSAKATQTVMVEPEKCFSGIQLSKLTELAKEVRRGLSCTIDEWGFLVFHYKSNRGHQTLHAQMTLDETGKLINLGGHYHNQWYSCADEFAKRANEMFQFKS